MATTTRIDDDQLDAQEVASAPPGAQGLVVEAVAPLHATEDETAVRKAISNIFPTMTLGSREGAVVGIGEGAQALAHLRRRLRDMRIRNTARSQLLAGSSEDTVTIALNKQSAYANIPNFSTGGAPLGDIEVTIRGEDLSSVVHWLCELDAEL